MMSNIKKQNNTILEVLKSAYTDDTPLGLALLFRQLCTSRMKNSLEEYTRYCLKMNSTY